MLRFAANLGYLFTERLLLERIDAAAAAGFKAVELQFPFDVPATAVKAAIRKNNLTILGLNTPPGEREGEFGLAAVPGREKDWQVLRERWTMQARSVAARFTVLPERSHPSSAPLPIAYSSTILHARPTLRQPRTSHC